MNTKKSKTIIGLSIVTSLYVTSIVFAPISEARYSRSYVRSRISRSRRSYSPPPRRYSPPSPVRVYTPRPPRRPSPPPPPPPPPRDHERRQRENAARQAALARKKAQERTKALARIEARRKAEQKARIKQQQLEAKRKKEEEKKKQQQLEAKRKKEEEKKKQQAQLLVNLIAALDAQAQAQAKADQQAKQEKQDRLAAAYAAMVEADKENQQKPYLPGTSYGITTPGWSGGCSADVNGISTKISNVLGASSEGEVLGTNVCVDFKAGSPSPTYPSCGGQSEIRCGDPANPDHYSPNKAGEILYGNAFYNPLIETINGTGYWTSGAATNSGYTIAEADAEELCGKGPLNGYVCMQVFKNGVPQEDYKTVSDAWLKQLQSQAQHDGYYGADKVGSGIYVLTTTSFNCGGCTCYDNGWRQCNIAPPTPNKAEKVQKISIHAQQSSGGTHAQQSFGGTGTETTGTTPPTCINYAPEKPSLVFPPNNAVINLDEVDLQWDQNDWGKNCGGNNNEFYVILEKVEKGNSAL